MLKQFFIAVIVAGSVQHAFASAMSEELSKCFALQVIAKDHEAWKTSFRRFQKDRVLTLDQKLHVQKKTIRLVLERLIRVQILSSQDSKNRSLINDASRFVFMLEEDLATKTSAQVFLSQALPKFEVALDAALDQAAIDNHNCDIFPEVEARAAGSVSRQHLSR